VLVLVVYVDRGIMLEYVKAAFAITNLVLQNKQLLLDIAHLSLQRRDARFFIRGASALLANCQKLLLLVKPVEFCFKSSLTNPVR